MFFLTAGDYTFALKAAAENGDSKDGCGRLRYNHSIVSKVIGQLSLFAACDCLLCNYSGKLCLTFDS